MSFYQVNLAAFIAIDAYLLFRQHRLQHPADTLLGHVRNNDASAKNISKFKRDFFLVYGLATAADWLQGPHIYAMYKYEKQIPEKLVALLYATGFVSGAASAPFAGRLADRYGRRLACLLYCVCYIITCCTMLTDNLPTLFVGRIFGGVATTLLFSVFEAWMITEYHRGELHNSSLALSHVFANMTALSGIVAILSGIIGDVLVGVFETRICPFVVSIVCCVIAAALMLLLWQENLGQENPEHPSPPENTQTISKTLRDGQVIALGIISCFFEGAMYLFVFFWSATLKSARTRAGSQEELPYGLIFSSFMCAMMAGSAIFSICNKPHSSERVSHLLRFVLLAVSASLVGAAILTSEHLLFWTLCLIEAAVGAYYPSMAYLKSEKIADEIRGSVYSIIRFPLNVFVVAAHSLDEEGDKHRNRVFLTCATLLLLAVFVLKTKI